MMCIQTRDKPVIIARLKASRLSRVLLETGTILSCLVLPVMIIWVPFYDNDIEYGFNGLCQIKLVNDSHSPTSIDNILVYFYGYAPVELALIAMFGTFVLYCTLSSKIQHHQHAKRVIRNLTISYLVVILFTVAHTIVEVISNKVELATLSISLFLTNLEKIALLIGYLLLFHFSKVCGPLKKFVRRNKEPSCHTQHNNNKYGTFRETKVPSSTYFSIGYTGAFTTISDA